MKKMCSTILLLLVFLVGSLFSTLITSAGDKATDFSRVSGLNLMPELNSFASSGVQATGPYYEVGTNNGASPSGGTLLFGINPPNDTESLKPCLQAKLKKLHVWLRLDAYDPDPGASWSSFVTNDLNYSAKVNNYSINNDTDMPEGSAEISGEGFPARGNGTNVSASGAIEYGVDVADMPGNIEDYFIGVNFSGFSQATLEATNYYSYLEYDTSECVMDVSIKKTLLNPAAVTKGGMVSFRIDLENRGNTPINLRYMPIYDFSSPDLSYISFSTDSGLVCDSFNNATLDDLVEGQEQETVFHNHLMYGVAFCYPEGNKLIGIGEELSLTLNFKLSDDSESLLNYAMILSLTTLDPDSSLLQDSFDPDNYSHPGTGNDLFDRYDEGILGDTNNMSVVRFSLKDGFASVGFSNSGGYSGNPTTTPGDLADTGQESLRLEVISLVLSLVAAKLILQRKKIR